MILTKEKLAEEIKPGDSFCLGEKKYTYMGDRKFKVEDIPEYVKPPGIHWAFSKDFIFNKRKSGPVHFGDTKCCHNCAAFGPCMFSAPAGWCGKHRSKKVNCSDFEVCKDFEERMKIDAQRW